MMRPGKALSEHHFLEMAASEIEFGRYDARQAAGVLNTYGLDSSWIKPTMSWQQVAAAVWARADAARYYART